MTPERRATWATGALAVAVLATLLRSQVAPAIAGDPLLVLCADALLVEAWLGAIAVLLSLLSSRGPSEALGMAPPEASQRGLTGGEVACLALGVLAASHALDGALELLGDPERGLLGELPRRLEDARGGRLLLALLALGLAPGIAEELLCRGLVQRALARRFGPRIAIAGAASLFGLLHVDPIHASFALLLGLYLGWIAHAAGSTRPAIVCHVVNNAAAVTLAAFVGDPAWASSWSVAGGTTVARACWIGVARRRSPRGIQARRAAPL